MHIGDEMEINKEREAFEKLWTGGNGHLRFFKFDHDACKYLLNGVSDNLPKGDLLSASITLNTAWLFWLGAKKQATPEGFVLVPKESLKVALFWMDEEIDPWSMSGDSFADLYEHKPILKKALEAQEQSHD